MQRRRFSQTMASEWQTVAVSHKMPWCALLAAVKNYIKNLEKLLDFFFKTETKTKCSRPRPKLHDPRPRPKAPRDQDPGLEDYITVSWKRYKIRPKLLCSANRKSLRFLPNRSISDDLE